MFVTVHEPSRHGPTGGWTLQLPPPPQAAPTDVDDAFLEQFQGIGAEVLARAYCLRLGFTASVPDYDRDNVDLVLRRSQDERVPSIDVQVKSCRTLEERNDCLGHDLKAKAFKFLGASKPVGPPRRLLLVDYTTNLITLPTMHQQGVWFPTPIYWYSLEGTADGIDPSSSRRIWIPRANLLTRVALAQMFEDAYEGYTPIPPRQSKGGA